MEILVTIGSIYFGIMFAFAIYNYLKFIYLMFRDGGSLGPYSNSNGTYHFASKEYK